MTMPSSQQALAGQLPSIKSLWHCVPVRRSEGATHRPLLSLMEVQWLWLPAAVSSVIAMLPSPAGAAEHYKSCPRRSSAIAPWQVTMTRACDCSCRCWGLPGPALAGPCLGHWQGACGHSFSQCAPMGRCKSRCSRWLAVHGALHAGRCGSSSRSLASAAVAVGLSG